MPKIHYDYFECPQADCPNKDPREGVACVIQIAEGERRRCPCERKIKLGEENRVAPPVKEGGIGRKSLIWAGGALILALLLILIFIPKSAVIEIADGTVRFGGEGHLARLSCIPIPQLLEELLTQALTAPFALVTPGLWGGPKLSIREPIVTTIPRGHFPWHREGKPPGILTERPRPWRYRLGEGSREPSPWPGERPARRRLSRGRWALPAGSCYHVAGDPLDPWAEWPEDWFPKEGFSLKHLGTALSLPIA